jgi:hypothetical protein
MKRPDVEKYEAMASKASEGPWSTAGKQVRGADGWCARQGVANCLAPWPSKTKGDPWYRQARANAEFIAASRTAIPELCAYIRELEAIIRDWRGVCAQACGGSDECVERAKGVAQ